MDILIIGKFYTEGFALHIAETLSAMGHRVRRYEPGVKTGRLPGAIGHRVDQVRDLLFRTTDGVPAIREHRRAGLWEAAESGPLDLTIVCHDFLWPAEVAELKRRTGTAVAMWFPDALSNFGRGFFMNAPYDALFFKDPYIVRTLGSVLRSPIHYLPECFNPEMHRAPDGCEDDPVYVCDVTTAGNQHSYRVAVLAHLAEWDVKLWGPPAPTWAELGSVAAMYQRRPVFGEDKGRAFRAARIVLNNLHYAEIWGMNVRTFEAAGIGAFQLVDWRPALSGLFVDGKELVSFRGMEDLRSKVRHWLPREEERRAIAQAGAERAHAEHTYRHRLELLIDTVSGDAEGYAMPDDPSFSGGP